MKDIEFCYIGEYAFNVHERPVPSKSYIPDWFRDMPPYSISDENPDGNKIIVKDFESNVTAKKCIPMLDAITTGYTVPLWADVQIKQSDGGPIITWRVSQSVFSIHGNYGSTLIPPPTGYANIVFKYNTSFRVKTPRGHSIMIRNVAGHNDLPFYPVPAIVDTDKSVIDTNIPLWISSDFEGIVEKETPVAQIIPFQRDNWSSKFTYITEEKIRQEIDKHYSSNIVNNYVKNIWTKKRFT